MSHKHGMVSQRGLALPLALCVASSLVSAGCSSGGEAREQGAGSVLGAGEPAGTVSGGGQGVGAGAGASDMGAAEASGSEAPAGGATSAGAGEMPSDGVPAGAGGSGSSASGQLDSVGLRTVGIRNAPASVISRLTRTQFVNSAAALLGDAAAAGVLELLPAPVPNGGFANSGFAQSQTYDVVLAYDSATRRLVENVTDWSQVHARFGGCAAYECVQDFIASFGEGAFRRPLSAPEVQALLPIVDAAQADGLSYDEAAALLVRALLQAPEFLYFFEDEQLTDHQLAARLSYFVSDGPPDEALYASLRAGELRNPGVLEAHADRLIELGGERFARAFAFDLFGLRKVHQRVVEIDAAVLDALVDSAEQSFARLLTRDAPVQDLFTTDTFSVDDTTKAFLGVSADSELQSSDAYAFMGLLTHPAVLIANSNAVEGSMVTRGQFIAHQLLCIPPTPPPATPFNPEDVASGLPENATQRDEAEARLQDVSCAPCHVQFEPYAFALNRWGGDGVFKDDERLDDSGPITTSLGEFAFDDYRGFLPLVAQSEQYRRCITDQMLRYGLRHTAYDPSVVDGVLAQADTELTFKGLARAVVMSEVFGVRGTLEAP